MVLQSFCFAILVHITHLRHLQPRSIVMDTFARLVEEHITCSVCAYIMFEPETLGCGHNFCSSCLQAHIAHQRANYTIPNCPKCRAAILQRPGGNHDLRALANTALEQIVPHMAPHDAQGQRAAAIEQRQAQRGEDAREQQHSHVDLVHPSLAQPQPQQPVHIAPMHNPEPPHDDQAQAPRPRPQIRSSVLHGFFAFVCWMVCMGRTRSVQYGTFDLCLFYFCFFTIRLASSVESGEGVLTNLSYVMLFWAAAGIIRLW